MLDGRASRRTFLRQSGVQVGGLALAALMRPHAQAAPHFAPRAKRVISLFMHGGPSQIDLFDYKPVMHSGMVKSCLHRFAATNA